jgi:hypothetical protein
MTWATIIRYRCETSGCDWQSFTALALTLMPGEYFYREIVVLGHIWNLGLLALTSLGCLLSLPCTRQFSCCQTRRYHDQRASSVAKRHFAHGV